MTSSKFLTKKDLDYPSWVCYDCGHKAQTDPLRKAILSTYHMGHCEVCNGHVPVTEPRDFGYPPFVKVVRDGDH